MTPAMKILKRRSQSLRARRRQIKSRSKVLLNKRLPTYLMISSGWTVDHLQPLLTLRTNKKVGMEY